LFSGRVMYWKAPPGRSGWKKLNADLPAGSKHSARSSQHGPRSCRGTFNTVQKAANMSAVCATFNYLTW
jgi:hypothetical protein